MRIRTRLQLSVVLSVVLATTVGLLFILSIHAMNEASRKAEIAAEVVKGVVELKILTDEYLLHPGDRSLIQWRSRYNSITKRLTGGYFRRPDDKIAVDQILKNLKRIKTVFGEITFGMRKKQRLDKQKSEYLRYNPPGHHYYPVLLFPCHQDISSVLQLILLPLKPSKT